MIFSLTQSSRKDSWFKQNADILDQGLLFTSNTAILAASIFRSVPSIITRSARTYCSFTGVLSIHFQFWDLEKFQYDFTLALQHKDWKSLSYTAAKTALKATDIFLTLGSFAISYLNLAGYPGCNAAYYRAVIPVATFSWFSLIAFDLLDHFQNKDLLGKMEEIKDVAKQEELCRAFKGESASPESGRLARLLRRQFDYYRLYSLQHTGVTYKSLLDNLKATVTLKRADIGLILYGYFCLGINKRYPETTVQALTAWSASALYTCKLVYRKYFAVTQKLYRVQQTGKSLLKNVKALAVNHVSLIFFGCFCLGINKRYPETALTALSVSLLYTGKQIYSNDNYLLTIK